jgi:poly-gamma-glutamate synthesis protein (capsule biosynthesis protein)
MRYLRYCLFIIFFSFWGYSSESSIILVGDILLAFKAKPILEKHGYGHPFQHLKAFLSEAEVVIGNLEFPISNSGKAWEKKKFTFRAPPQAIKGLLSGGINVVSLANNHILDYGPEALSDTLFFLKKHNISFTGAGQNLFEAREPVIKIVSGARVGILAYSLTQPESFYAGVKKSGTAPAYLNYLKEDIKKLRKKVEIVIISFHWGKEYSSQPTQYQINLAHQTVNFGADVVFGHHPHVIQGVEIYQGKLIAYSLGNFTFGSYNRGAKIGLILKLKIKNKKLNTAYFFPLLVDNFEVNFAPRLLKGNPAQEALSELKKLSERFKTPLKIQGERAEIKFSER